MKPIYSLIALFALAATSIFAGVAPVEQQEEDLDKIILFNRAQTLPPTRVKDDNYVKVTGQFHGSNITREGYLVKEVVYSDADTNYQTAIEKRDEGRYTLAALYFSKALEALKDRKWAAEYCNYGLGQAFYAAGIFDGYKGRARSYEPAVEYFKRALEANPKSRYMLDIVTKIPICYAEQKKINEANAAIADATARIKAYRDETGKISTGYTESADRATVQLMMAKARVMEESVALNQPGVGPSFTRDLWREARNKAKTFKFAELEGESVEGELRALIDMKQYEEAKAEASTIIENFNTKNEYRLMALLPAAYSARGMANLAQALEFETKKNKPMADNSFAEARWDFLNVIAQFFDNDDYVAAAHYRAGICYEKLATVETDAKPKAVREWQAIVVNFPKSEYKERAVAKLKENGVTVEEEKKPDTAAAPAKPEQPAAPKQPAPPAPKKDPKKDKDKK